MTCEKFTKGRNNFRRKKIRTRHCRVGICQHRISIRQHRIRRCSNLTKQPSGKTWMKIGRSSFRLWKNFSCGISLRSKLQNFSDFRPENAPEKKKIKSALSFRRIFRKTVRRHTGCSATVWVWPRSLFLLLFYSWNPEIFFSSWNLKIFLSVHEMSKKKVYFLKYNPYNANYCDVDVCFLFKTFKFQNYLFPNLNRM